LDKKMFFSTIDLVEDYFPSTTTASSPTSSEKRRDISFNLHKNIITKMSHIDPIANVLFSASLDNCIVKWQPPRVHLNPHFCDSNLMSNILTVPVDTSPKNSLVMLTRSMEKQQQRPHSPLNEDLSIAVNLNNNNMNNNNNNNMNNNIGSNNNGNRSSNNDEISKPDPYIPLARIRVPIRYSICSFVDGNSKIITCDNSTMTLWDLSYEEQSKFSLTKIQSINLPDMEIITCVEKLGKLIFLGSGNGRCKVIEIVSDSSGLVLKNHMLLHTTIGTSHGVSNVSGIYSQIEPGSRILWRYFNQKTDHHKGRVYGISIIGSSTKKYLLVTYGADGMVKIWNLLEQQAIKSDSDARSSTDPNTVISPLYSIRVATLIQISHPYVDAGPIYRLENISCDDGSEWHVRFWVNEADRRIVSWSCKISQACESFIKDREIEVSELQLFENLGQFYLCRIDNTDLRDGNGNIDLLLLGWSAKYSRFDIYHLVPKPNSEKRNNKLCFLRTKVKSFKTKGTVFIKDCGIRAIKLLVKNIDTEALTSEIEANVWYANQNQVEGFKFNWTRPSDKKKPLKFTSSNNSETKGQKS